MLERKCKCINNDSTWVDIKSNDTTRSDEFLYTMNSLKELAW